MNIESGHIIITVLVLIVLAMGWLFVLNTQELQEIKAVQAAIQAPPQHRQHRQRNLSQRRSRLSTHTPKPLARWRQRRACDCLGLLNSSFVMKANASVRMRTQVAHRQSESGGTCEITAYRSLNSKRSSTILTTMLS